ncbi:Protein of unknown function [Cotesia congregata]|uniref:Uncharacterized protein n=1 Tax=Cotesia congregata TaxID=51543 RepID=A0A8J2EAW5_COTCN|nr:Protein of unknown function [Cotesia congregata]
MTLSLTDVGKCKFTDSPPQTERVNIYLLQPAEVSHLHDIECKIFINRHIQHCGMHSHTSAVLYGRREYYLSMDYEKCKKMHETNSVWLFDRIPFNELQMNTTNHRQAVLAGSQSMSGECQPGTYSDVYGTWSGVVVDALFKITISEYEAALNKKTNQVVLSSGTRCDSEKRSCVTSEGATAYWSEIPKNSYLMNQCYKISAPPEDSSYAGVSQQVKEQICGNSLVNEHVCARQAIVARNRDPEGVKPGSQIDLLYSEQSKV